MHRACVLFQLTYAARVLIRCRFSNLGNTCYMNAILQALFALVPFSTDLLNVSDRLDADSATDNHRSVHYRACLDRLTK